ncbi:MAG: hypothetical protein ACRBBP_11060 [Bdellovibrionales bacterium]
MGDLISKLEQLAPQWFLAMVAILGAVAFMVYSKPPHQLCDTQKDAFVRQQKKFLASRNYDSFFERCLLSNNRGACEPYFRGFEKILEDFKTVDGKCHKVVASSPRVRSALQSFLIQTVRLAWGDNGPSTVHNRGGWFGPSHYRTFCRIKSQYQRSYGEATYRALVKKVISVLPNERKLTRLQKEDRSLFSTPCSQYF